MQIQRTRTEIPNLLQELKTLLQLAGVGAHDTLLANTLDAAIPKVEGWCGIAIGETIVRLKGSLVAIDPDDALPVLPVWTVPAFALTSVVDAATITRYTATYTAGYSVVSNAEYPLPDDLKEAVLRCAVSLLPPDFQAGSGVNLDWKCLARPYRQIRL